LVTPEYSWIPRSVEKKQEIFKENIENIVKKRLVNEEIQIYSKKDKRDCKI